MRSTVLIREVRSLPQISTVIARGDPHKFGKIKARPVGKKLPTGAKPAGVAKQSNQRNRPVLQKQKIQGKPAINSPAAKPAGKPVAVKPKAKIPAKTIKWWAGLSPQEQKIYIKSHPKTRLKLSKKSSSKHKAKVINPPTPVGDKPAPTPDSGAAPAAPAPEKTKLSLHDILRRAKKTISAHDFARMFSNSGKLQQSAADASPEIKTTLTQSGKIQQKAQGKAKPLPEPKTAQQATQQLFGHLATTSDNKIIRHVSKHLSPHDKELLGQAMQEAEKHPDRTNPPRSFRKSLGRVLTFALTAGVGGALLGPAGVLLAIDGFNQFKNKTGETLPKFAWRALTGKSLKAEDVQREESERDEGKDMDATERPIAKIIKGLKLQLAQTEDDKQREPMKNLIEELGDRLDQYQTYEKDNADATPAGNLRKRRR
jgi:hypothetical protein